MPPKAIDYSKTIIYKIVCNDLNITDCYVGHTTEFSKRKWCHKTRCNNKKDKKHNLKVYQMIRANGGWDNWTMVQIEEYPCLNGNEALAKERYYYELLNAKLNNNVPNRTHIESVKSYKETNKEKYNEYQKIFREANKDKINEYHKIFREENKDKINEKFDCECGSRYSYCNKSRHLKTQKHINKTNINEI